MGYLTCDSQPSWEGGKARSQLNSRQFRDVPCWPRSHSEVRLEPRAPAFPSASSQGDVIPVTQSSSNSGHEFWRTPLRSQIHFCVNAQTRAPEHSHAEKVRACVKGVTTWRAVSTTEAET